MSCDDAEVVCAEKLDYMITRLRALTSYELTSLRVVLLPRETAVYAMSIISVNTQICLPSNQQV
jgi:hypothetical protein